MNDALQNCEFCHSPAHTWMNCPKKPDGWKPERLRRKEPAVRNNVAKPPLPRKQVPDDGATSTAVRKDAPGVSSQPGSPEALTSADEPNGIRSGYQAPPVDTESLPASKADVPTSGNDVGAGGEANLTRRGTPRIRAPKGTFDRKAYQREAARKRRAKAKEMK